MILLSRTSFLQSIAEVRIKEKRGRSNSYCRGITANLVLKKRTEFAVIN